MFKSIRKPVAVLLAFSMAGCATLVGGGSHQSVQFTSDPGRADFTVNSSSGLQMAEGVTPSTVRLPRKNEYQIEITLDGYETETVVLTKSLNGWVWGNLLFGWIIGFAIDFVTGSAYKLEPAFVQVSLDRTGGMSSAVVQLLDEQGRVIDTRRIELTPVR